MDPWLYYSLASCFFYSTWTLTLKLATKTIDSNTINLLQLPIRVVLTLMTALQRIQTSSSSATSILHKSSFVSLLEYIGNLNFYGVIFTIVSCSSTVIAGFLYSDALSSGGSGPSVAVISGCYPALAYVMGVLLGLEELDFWKVCGVILAFGSCICFAIGSR